MRARFPWRVYGWVLAGIVVLAIAPVLSAFIAGGIASANDCTLNEGSIHTCMIAGSDWGNALYTMFVMGWLGMLTLPLGAMAILALVLVLSAHQVLWRRRKPRLPHRGD